MINSYILPCGSRDGSTDLEPCMPNLLVGNPSLNSGLTFSGQDHISTKIDTSMGVRVIDLCCICQWNISKFLKYRIPMKLLKISDF